LAVSTARLKAPLQVVYTEPVRVCLSVIWFWVSIEFLLLKRSFVVKWLAVSVVVQFLMAAYLYLALFDLVPVPATVTLYLDDYKGRQPLELGGMEIYRMAGTFIESPPFGLFMFSCFVVLVLWIAKDATTRDRKSWAIVGAVVSLIGVICSLSDQIFIAAMAFGSIAYLAVRREFVSKERWRTVVELVILPVFLLAGIWYVVPRVMEKVEEAASTSMTDTDILGRAGAERMFHTVYALGRFGEKPMATWTGIGPGRYGDYAFRTGRFAVDVTIQNTPLLWLVEYGVFGFCLILLWLWNIAKRGYNGYGTLALGAGVALFVANLTQATWISEAWFLALAFLYTAMRDDGRRYPGAKAQTSFSSA
jgi:hypothetical protein